MKKTLAAAVTLLIAFTVSAAQSVTITPQKRVYRRIKPMSQYKKTFTVRRPIAKAASPAVSKKITSAIDPVKIFDINIKEEIGEVQWLSEADYEVVYNKNGVLTMKLWMEGSGAYPDGSTRYVVVDNRTGNIVTPSAVFADLSGLAAVIRKMQVKEVDAAIKELKADPENKDTNVAEVFENTNFTADDLKEFSVTASGVTFHYDYGFPHVIQALEPEGEYKLTWVELKPFIKPASLLARFAN